ncbi:MULTISPECIES: hypothetical protein [Methylomonas]|uniref:Restriction endonuclease n=1 Tax=Methylomonas koyamae TaxID=702114 RepID=A0A177NYA4_9GAMM|nr:hypothetical protein [Methylomonas koyamae]OAI23026.1 hypothetical protein A1355_01715 [Methylomonas koyamae]
MNIFPEITERKKYNHTALQCKIDLIRNLYEESSINLNSTSQLHELLKSAEKLAFDWSTGNNEAANMDLLFKSLHIERISSATQKLRNEIQREKYLRDLLKGTLNFFERKSSHAKNILWELEVFTQIRETISDTSLAEPDIVVSIQNQKIAIPCKKIYSEKGVSKVLSNAVYQFENIFDFGIVAMNIDDLIPENTLLQARTFEELGNKLHSNNMTFLANHERCFRKYLSKSRIIGVIVSTALVADIIEESPKFNNAHQWTIWTTPELLPNHAKAISFFREKVIGA